jgi:replicative DNA helicase
VTSFEPSLFGLSQRQPPSNLRAEQALLGALLANNKTLDGCAGLLPEHFYDPLNGWIFEECRKRIEAGRLVDTTTLASALAGAPQWDLHTEKCTPYLVNLLSSMIVTNNTGEYALTIRETFRRRELIEIGQEVVHRAFGSVPSDDAELIATEATARIDAVASDGGPDNGSSFADAARAVVLRSGAAHRGDAGFGRLDTGVAPIDGLWRGLWPGQLYYLMARSRTGKTPLMMQIARHVGRTLLDEGGGGCVHVFSLEMSADDLLTINLAAETRWTADQIKAGDIGNDKAWFDYDQAATALGRLPIHIDDKADLDLDGIRSRARAVKRQKKTRLILVDYRELVRRGRDQRMMGLPEWMPFLGYGLKAIAKTLNVPVIALAQINKSRDIQESTRPTLSDLPYDGGQAADGVFALHRPELFMGDEPPAGAIGMTPEKKAARYDKWRQEREAVRGLAEFHALKRRFGPPGFCQLRFDGPRMKFSELPKNGEPIGQPSQERQER